MKATSAFLRRLREDPEFREEVRRIILTDELLALPAKEDYHFRQILIILQDLAEAQRRTEDQLSALAQRVDGLAQRVDALAQRVDALAQQVADLVKVQKQLTVDVGVLKGRTLEAEWARKAPAYLGRWFRRVRVLAGEDLWNLLYDAADRGLLDLGEADEVARADVVLEAQDVRVVVEVSAAVDGNDVRRARQRADLLSRLGVPAVAVAVGEKAPEDVRQEARRLGVWVIEDGRRVVGPEE